MNSSIPIKKVLLLIICIVSVFIIGGSYAVFTPESLIYKILFIVIGGGVLLFIIRLLFDLIGE
jgi:hypothetical protein